MALFTPTCVGDPACMYWRICGNQKAELIEIVVVQHVVNFAFSVVLLDLPVKELPIQLELSIYVLLKYLFLRSCKQIDFGVLRDVSFIDILEGTVPVQAIKICLQITEKDCFQIRLASSKLCYRLVTMS